MPISTVICWSAAGFVFTADTSVAVAAPDTATNPIHGALRIAALAAFMLGGFLWLDVSRRPPAGQTLARTVYAGTAQVVPLPPADTTKLTPRTDADDGLAHLDDIRLLKAIDDKLKGVDGP